MYIETLINTSIDIPAESREKVIPVLNAQLADLADLQSQTKQAHWNVKGPNFIALHELFDKLAAELSDFADMTAERITALGGLAAGTVRQSAQNSRLNEMDLNNIEQIQVLKTLTEGFAQLASSTREAIRETEQAGDASSADLMTEISRGLDKSLYFLEAHLQS
jgi:starvation-inducible DNA-binding protein